MWQSHRACELICEGWFDGRTSCCSHMRACAHVCMCVCVCLCVIDCVCVSMCACS